MTQFWKGQRIVYKGMLGTVYQDQGLDQTVKITVDRLKNVVESVNPKKLYLIQSRERQGQAEWFIDRRYVP